MSLKHPEMSWNKKKIQIKDIKGFDKILELIILFRGGRSKIHITGSDRVPSRGCKRVPSVVELTLGLSFFGYFMW